MGHVDTFPLTEERKASAIQALVLQRLYGDELRDLCDFQVTVSGTSTSSPTSKSQTFPCHRAVLCGASDVLRALVRSEWKNTNTKSLTLELFTPDTFACVLRYIYTGEVVLGRASLIDVHCAAKQLLMPELDTAVRSMILMSICSRNALVAGRHATLFDDDELEQACENYVLDHFEKVSETSDFLALDLGGVLHFVGSDRLVLCDSEVSIVRAVVRWVGHNESERGEFAEELVRTIRLDEMSVEEKQAALRVATKCSAVRQVLLTALYDETQVRGNEADFDLGNAQEDDLPTGGPAIGWSADSDEEYQPAVSASPVRRARQRGSRGAYAARHSEVEVSGPRFRVQRRCMRNIRFDFVVRNISRLRLRCESANSPWYKCGGGLLWRLEVYPHGGSPEVSNFVSAFLRCSEEASSEEFVCTANFTLFIVEQTVGNQTNVFQATKAFTHAEPCWGKSRYIRYDELFAGDQSLSDPCTDSVVVGASITW